MPTNLVFSDGNINSKIMIIGEGPGANEDIGGKAICWSRWQIIR